jgi:hypothetical protein
VCLATANSGLRQHDFQQALGTQARLYGRQASDHVDVPALSPFHHPITSRFILAQGFYLDAQNPWRSFTLAIQPTFRTEALILVHFYR